MQKAHLSSLGLGDSHFPSNQFINRFLGGLGSFFLLFLCISKSHSKAMVKAYGAVEAAPAPTARAANR